jgi:NAD(P)-dependent dehydrogenase (short-subunit alcohol dehydrogenase family)
MNGTDFTGKRFIVSGAGGIGAETAKLLNGFGASIILLDISEDNLNNTLDALSGEGNKAYNCDFSDIDGIETVIKQIVAENGLIDGFIHCVGIGAVRPLKMSKYDFMLKVMNINFFSFVEIVRCLSAKGRYNPEGMNVVGISALGAYLGNTTKTAYCASKGAMNAAVRCMAKELAHKNIRVNTVAPGVTDTPMARATEDYGSYSDGYKMILARQYLGICQPIDIANAIAFLLSDMSKMITGTCLPVDGGKLTS